MGFQINNTSELPPLKTSYFFKTRSDVQPGAVGKSLKHLESHVRKNSSLRST